MPSVALRPLTVRPLSARPSSGPIFLETLEGRQLMSTAKLPFAPPFVMDSPTPASTLKSITSKPTSSSGSGHSKHRGSTTKTKTPVDSPTTPTAPSSPTTPTAPTAPTTPSAPVSTPTAPTTPVSTPTTPTTPSTPATPSAPSTSSLTFPLYDATFTEGTPVHTTAQGFEQAWWTSAAPLTNSAGVYDPSYAAITNIATIAKNGGNAPWSGQAIAAGTPVFLDFESDSTESFSYYQQRLDWFHQTAPDVKVGIWGVPLGWNNMDKNTVVSDTPQVIAQVDANLQAEAPMINDMNMMTLSAYMLGTSEVNRDLNWITILAREYHKMFPGKEVVCWTWGAYHTTWNPPNDVLPDDVTQRYIQTAMSNCDSLLLWGPDVDDVKMKQIAYQMDLTASSAAPASQPADANSIVSSLLDSTDPASVLT